MSERELLGRPSRVTLHLTPEPVWLEQRAPRAYRSEQFSREGFVHCTDGEVAVLAVANRYYRDDPGPFLLLDIDLARVAAFVTYEDAERRFPHIYGPIERDAVRCVRRVERGTDGTFAAIGLDIWE